MIDLHEMSDEQLAILAERRVLGVPDYVPFPEPTREAILGIGALDDEYVDMTNVTEWPGWDEPHAPWWEAGELWAIALKGGDTLRRRAMRLHEHHRGYYPEHADGSVQVMEAERERGIPAWDITHEDTTTPSGAPVRVITLR